MGRKPNDGRGRLGGRQPGVPNKKDSFIINALRRHSEEFLTPDPKTGQSPFDETMAMLAPDDRMNAEIKIMEFHTPRRKAVDVDLDARTTVKTIEDRLRELCGQTGEEEE